MFEISPVLTVLINMIPYRYPFSLLALISTVIGVEFTAKIAYYVLIGLTIIYLILYCLNTYKFKIEFEEIIG